MADRKAVSSDPSPQPEQGQDDVPEGRRASLRARAREVPARLVEARGRHASVDTSFQIFERDQRIAASVLAGGIAYRLFFWSLPVALIAGGVLGFTSPGTAEEIAEDAGLTGAAVDAVGESAADANRARWALLLIGVSGLVWTSTRSVLALRRVYSLIWNVPPVRSKNPLTETLAFSGTCLLLLAVPAAADRLRDAYEGPGLAVTFLSMGAFFGIWLWVSLQLPHADAPPRALIPGAAVFALAAQAMHLFIAFYLADKLERSSALYGGLGLAATSLFFLYLVGRLVVSAAILNAELWRGAESGRESESNSPG
ncbi:MAG TPA: YhjD/YihY/BrkB family envelope integrity protein [Gaiellaceae bacterium]|jgi:uncharacterized BrkB/YihY/UPF0761 family membrane protein|nr:YhjD/YihY/BrkB family envelope integrity protein [Gaiellaceae bacterium]